MCFSFYDTSFSLYKKCRFYVKKQNIKQKVLNFRIMYLGNNNLNIFFNIRFVYLKF